MTSNKKQTRNIDKEIGKKIRLARLNAELSQDDLGRLIGVTFQQVQKYELGTNRLSIGRLLDISRALNVNVTHFLDGNFLPAVREIDRSSLALISHYSRIKNKKAKRQLVELAKSLST